MILLSEHSIPRLRSQSKCRTASPRGCPALLISRTLREAPVQPDLQPDRDTCSAKGCQADAVWALLWNNPKIHTPDRRKTWLACDEHRESLSD